LESCVAAARQVIKLDPALQYHPKRIVSIVSPSRSGSTVFKYALCLHPDLCSLAGEEEPYYKLARNGYPWHTSDEFHAVNDPEFVQLAIANELHNFQSTYNRSILQQYSIEEPPFVSPVLCNRLDTIVFKTPQNCYRRGVLEQLYPDAEIVYIIMTRSPHGIINGLMDGWLSGQFTARLTPGGWWCFDMPPNWTWGITLLERCINQWRMATSHIDRNYHDAACRVPFEEFEDNWRQVCQQVWALLGLSRYDPPDNTRLPILSATEGPRPERWKTKRPWLMEVL
jgi:hypothetical protein